MKNLTVVAIDKKSDTIQFNNGVKLYSSHEQDCCESHFLSLRDLSMSDFEGLEFDLTSDNFLKGSRVMGLH